MAAAVAAMPMAEPDNRRLEALDDDDDALPSSQSAPDKTPLGQLYNALSDDSDDEEAALDPDAFVADLDFTSHTSKGKPAHGSTKKQHISDDHQDGESDDGGNLDEEDDDITPYQVTQPSANDADPTAEGADQHMLESASATQNTTELGSAKKAVKPLTEQQLKRAKKQQREQQTRNTARLVRNQKNIR